MHLTRDSLIRAGTVCVTAVVLIGGAAGLGVLGASAASADTVDLNVAYSTPVIGGYGQQALSIAAGAPAMVTHGTNFTSTFEAESAAVPTTVDGGSFGPVSIGSIQGLTYIMPIPAGAIYVSSSVSGPATYAATATTAAGSVPVTATYCTSVSEAGCTATSATSFGYQEATFGGNTPLPYLEMSTPGSGAESPSTTDAIPAGATTTFPTVSVVLTASGATGSTIEPSISEFDTTVNTSDPFGFTLELEAWPSAVLTSAEEAVGQPLPAALVTPLSTTTITAPSSPPPTVTAVTPDTGPAAGGTVITITGTGFTAGATVTVGSALATGVKVVKATSITATTPSGSGGAVDVFVTDSEGMSFPSPADQFTYALPPPTVTGLSPVSGPTGGGSFVAVTGSGFTPTATVTIGGKAAVNVLVNSPTSLWLMTPAGPTGTANLVVTDANGTSANSLANQFTFMPATPSVTGLSVTSGPESGGTLVTITGTGFEPGVIVGFGADTASFVRVNSATTIVAFSPPGTSGVPGAVDVTVADLGGASQTSPADEFTYTPPTNGYPGRPRK